MQSVEQQFLDLSASVKMLATSESGFVFDPVNGKSFSTNDTGLLLLSYMKQEQPLEDVVGELTDRYKLDSHHLIQEITQYMMQLARCLS